MPLLLVRHAVALRRRDWTKPDHLRPLSPRGYAQADGIATLLAPFGIERILSSPSVRCVETVEPLAARLGLPLEQLDELQEGRGSAALPLLVDMSGPVVACTHGDVLPELLARLAPDAGGGEGFDCEKGSTWVVDDDGMHPTYLPPPV